MSVAVLMLSAALAASGQRTPESMLGAAIHQEEVEGDLKAAIAAYQKVLAAPGVSRKTAAETLLRIGHCYEALGNAESRKAYERVVREYAEQKDAVASARTRLAGTQTPPGPISRVLWSGSEREIGNVSADGRFFAYTDIPETDLFVHEMASGLDRNLTNSPKGSTSIPSCSLISPDGSQAAYCWHDKQTGKTELRVLNVSGDSSPRILYANPDVSQVVIFDWSSDGRSMAVGLRRIDHTAQIGILSFPDGSLRVLRSVEWSGPRVMQFSPDGKYLVYDLANDSGPGQAIFVGSVDGSREFKAVMHPSNNLPVGWSPDGRWLLFTSDRAGTPDLWTIAFANGNIQGSPQMLKGSVTGFLPHGWNRAGALYYAISHGGPVDKLHVASLDFNSGSFTSVPINRFLERGVDPAWSPDGKQLAFLTGNTPGVAAAIAIVSNETGVVRQVRPGNLKSFRVRNWSPNGRSILVDGRDLKGRPGVFLVDAGSGDASAVFTYEPNDGVNFSGADMAWLPDGRSFMIRGYGSKNGVYLVNVETGGLTALFVDPPDQISGDLKASLDGKRLFFNRRFQTKNQTAIIERDVVSGAEKELTRRQMLSPPRLSPDGQYLASGTSDPASNSRAIIVIPTAGGEPRELIRVPSEVRPEDLNNRFLGQAVWPPAWAPDSQSVVVRKNPADKTKDGELWLVPLNGAPPRSTDGRIPQTVGLLVSPDGRHFACTVTESPAPPMAELSILENFLPKTTAAKK
jgi:Tol biopolymer transport system component